MKDQFQLHVGQNDGHAEKEKQKGDSQSKPMTSFMFINHRTIVALIQRRVFSVHPGDCVIKRQPEVTVAIYSVVGGVTIHK
jgi:hypothetical protein